MKSNLDRILLGELHYTEFNHLEKLGEVQFELYSSFHYNTPRMDAVYQHKIVGKLSNNKKSWDYYSTTFSFRRRVPKKGLFKELNKHLTKMNFYLTKPEYSHPFCGRKKIKGILYREKNV